MGKLYDDAESVFVGGYSVRKNILRGHKTVCIRHTLR